MTNIKCPKGHDLQDYDYDDDDLAWHKDRPYKYMSCNKCDRPYLEIDCEPSESIGQLKEDVDDTNVTNIYKKPKRYFPFVRDSFRSATFANKVEPKDLDDTDVAQIGACCTGCGYDMGHFSDPEAHIKECITDGWIDFDKQKPMPNQKIYIRGFYNHFSKYQWKPADHKVDNKESEGCQSECEHDWQLTKIELRGGRKVTIETYECSKCTLIDEKIINSSHSQLLNHKCKDNQDCHHCDQECFYENRQKTLSSKEDGSGWSIEQGYCLTHNFWQPCPNDKSKCTCIDKVIEALSIEKPHHRIDDYIEFGHIRSIINKLKGGQ